MDRMKKAFGLFVCALIVFSLAAASLPVAGEQPVRFEKQPWFNPAAELFTDPARNQDPELFSPRSLETLWTGVHGAIIGPDCPVLLCATHPLGLALIAGGLLKAVNEEETGRLAETLMAMGQAYGNLYRRESLSQIGEAFYGQVEALCGILALRAAWREYQGMRQLAIYSDIIDPGVPLYSDVPGEFSLIAACLQNCPCAGMPEAVPQGDERRPDGGKQTQTMPPPETTIYLPDGMFQAITQPPTIRVPDGMYQMITPVPEVGGAITPLPDGVRNIMPVGPLPPDAGWIEPLP